MDGHIMLQVKDRIKELTTTSGTGTLQLSGTAEAGFQAFSVLGNGTKTYYTISDVNGTDFEIGLGTYSSNTLSRDTIFESSNSGSAITLSATGSTVFVSYPASKSAYSDVGVNRDYLADGNIDAGKPLILNTDNSVTQIAEAGNTVVQGVGVNQLIQSGGYYDGMSSLCWVDEANGIFAVGYLATNGYPTAVIGTVDGANKTITYGTVFTLSTSYTNTKSPSIAYDPNQSKLFMTFNNVNDGLSYGRFLSVSGTTIASVGVLTVMDTDLSYFQKVMYDTVNSVMLFLNLNHTSTNLEYCGVVMTGTTPSRNSATQQSLSQTNLFMKNGLSYDSSTGIFYVAQSVNNNDNIMQGAKWNGSSFTIGTASALITSTGDYSNETTQWYGTDYTFAHFFVGADGLMASVVTVDSSTLAITYSTPQLIIDSFSETSAVSYDSASGKLSLLGKQSSSSAITTVISISGTTFSLTTPVEFLTGNAQRCVGLPTSDTSQTENPTVFSYQNYVFNNINGESRVFTQGQSPVTNLSTDNYFGVASTNVVSGEQVGVNRSGSFNNNQSGMTAGVDQYATESGLIKERTTTTTVTDSNPTVSTVTTQDGSAYSNGGNSISYESTSGYYVRGRMEPSTNYPVVESGTWTSNSAGITWGTPTVLSSNNLRNYVAVTTGGGYSHVAYCTRENSNENAKITPVAISGSGAITLGTTTTVFTKATTSSFTDAISVEYDTSSNTIISFFNDGSTANSSSIIVASPLQMNGANYSFNSSDNVNILNGIEVHKTTTITVFDPDTQRTIFFYTKNNSPTSINGIVISCTGTTISLGATQTASFNTKPIDGGFSTATYDTQNNKIVFVYEASSPTNSAKYSIVTVTGGATNTLSYTADAYLFSNTSTKNETANITYDADANKLLYVYPDYFTYHFRCNTLTSNGSSLTSTQDVEISSEEWRENTPDNTSSIYVNNKGVAYSFGGRDGSYQIVNFTQFFNTVSTTVVNGSQFVGTARSGTDLELSEPPVELVGMANGSITKGRTVSVRTDGDFEQVKQIGTTNSGTASFSYDGVGATTTERFNNLSVADDGLTYGLIYVASGSTIAFKVGTRSGASITWGSAITIYTSSNGNAGTGVLMGLVYDSSAGCFVATYNAEPSNDWNASTITYSGNTATLVTTISLENNYLLSRTNALTYDADNQVCVAIASTQNAPTYVVGYVLTISSGGTSITKGSQGYYLTNGIAQYPKISKVGTNSFALYYSNSGSSNYPIIQMVTISGTTLTFGGAVTINSATAGYCSVVYNPNYTGKFIVMGNIQSNSYSYVPVSFTGTSLTVGSYTSGNVGSGSLTIENSNQVGDYSNYSGTYYTAWVESGFAYNTGTTNDGVTITWGTRIISSATAQYTGVTVNEVDGYAVSNDTNGSDIQILVWQPTYSFVVISYESLANGKFIGFAQNTVADNEDVKVAVISQSDFNQTGLTTASQYYVQNDGTLSTTAGTPSVLGGTALSSTKILIKS